MTWMTYRQFRTSLVVAVAGLAASAVLLALTTHHSAVPHGSFLGVSHDHLLKWLSTALVAVPGLVGAFWGAPLVARELETGSYRLAWTQSVTRTRWFFTKVFVIGMAGALTCGLLSLMLGWWSSAGVNRGRLSPSMFGERGIVPIGYALFALALGFALGAIIRRTVPAMAATLAGFLAARVVVNYWVRAHLAGLHHVTFALGDRIGFTISSGVMSVHSGSPNIPGAWIVSTRTVDSAGHAPTQSFLTTACGQLLRPSTTGGPPPDHVLRRCFSAISTRYHGLATYQPASHYWALQGAETALFTVAALSLTGLTFWWLRARVR